MTQIYPGGYPAQTAPAPYPQQFQQPAAFQPPAYPQPQQFAPGYPTPQLAPPPAPLAQGSIEDFYNQPSTGGGKFWKFPVVGTVHEGIVARAIGAGDIRQQTDPAHLGGKPKFYKDMRPKFEMLVPLQVTPDAEHQDGLATWAVRGLDRDELVRAMAEAGAPEGPPEAGAFIRVIYTHDKANTFGNPSKIKHVQYVRPGGTIPMAPAVQQPAAPVAPAPTYAAPVAYQQLPPTVQTAVYQQPAPVAPPAVPQAQTAPVAPPAPAPAVPTGLAPAEAALLQQLTQQAAAQQPQPQG